MQVHTHNTELRNAGADASDSDHLSDQQVHGVMFTGANRRLSALNNMLSR